MALKKSPPSKKGLMHQGYGRLFSSTMLMSQIALANPQK